MSNPEVMASPSFKITVHRPKDKYRRKSSENKSWGEGEGGIEIKREKIIAKEKKNQKTSCQEKQKIF